MQQIVTDVSLSGCYNIISDLPVHECVLEERRDGVDVVLAHLADVLEEEGERLEHAVL